MRKAIYKELTTLGIPVYQIGNLEAKEAPPYLLLKMETFVKSKFVGDRQYFSVKVFAPIGNMETLDILCEKVIRLLKSKHLNRISDKEGEEAGTCFFIEFDDCSDEDIEEVWGAVTKQIDFFVPVFGGGIM